MNSYLTAQHQTGCQPLFQVTSEMYKYPITTQLTLHRSLFDIEAPGVDTDILFGYGENNTVEIII